MADSLILQGRAVPKSFAAVTKTKTIFHVVCSRKGNNKFVNQVPQIEHNLIHFALQIQK